MEITIKATIPDNVAAAIQSGITKHTADDFEREGAALEAMQANKGR